MKRLILLTATYLVAGCISCTPSTQWPENKVTPGEDNGEVAQDVTVEQFHDRLFNSEYTETEKAFPNAMKGFRDKENFYCTLTKVYIGWSELESRASDDVKKIISYSNNKFQPFYNQGIRVIPRVYLCWPHDDQKADGSRVEIDENGTKKYCDVFWPQDMTNFDYESAQFKDRVVKLIDKLGQAWDNDKRVAYIEMGIIGYWGEHNRPGPTLEMQKILADAFLKSFKNKKIMIRYPDDFLDYDQFGFYNDSFGHYNESGRIPDYLKRDAWRNAPYGGEVAYGYGKAEIQPGTSPDVTLTTPKHLNYQIECIRMLHANHVGWIGNYTKNVPEIEAGAATLQKLLGYRFVIKKAKYTQALDAKRNDLKLEMNIVNVGSSLLYEEAPMRVALFDSKKKIVWSKDFSSVDASKWFPGENWDNTALKYKQAAPTYTVSETFNVDGNIAEGVYYLGVALLNKYDMVPAYKFAHDNYFKGGYTILGKVGYGVVPADPSINDISFSDIREDRLIY